VPTTAELLDLTAGIGQRSSTIRWDVLDLALTKVGEVTPLIGNASVEQNTNRRINRTLQGVTLAPTDQASLDPFGNRLRPVWVLENGAEFNLGVFILGSMDRARHEWGLEADVPAVDQTLILDQPLEQTVAYAAGTPIRDAIIDQFTIAGVPSFDVDVTITSQLANPISWPAGNTFRLDVVNDLAALGSAFSAYFDNDGVGRVSRIPDLASALPSLIYDSGGRILAGSMVESDDLLDAPNRYIVVDSGNPDQPISGFYDVPPEAPHSAANRGFVVATVISEQGLASEAEAVERARVAYEQHSSTFQWVQFSSPPDPRHDTHDAVMYLGTVYREQGWRLRLTEGSEMVHDLRRIYGVGA